MKNKSTESFIFITCKYFKSEKPIKSYDIQDIISVINNKKNIYKNYDIFILVRDKQDVLDKKKRLSCSESV